MANAENLRQELTTYDGRSPTILSEISVRYRDQPNFLSDLVRLAVDENPLISEGATWMLKAELEAGQVCSPQDVKRLVVGLKGVTAWQAQLHICQSIKHITVPQELALELERWLSALLDAPRPFLRAWALDAVCQLRGASPKTKALLAQMETDDAASVRARVRNLKRAFTKE